MPAPLPDETCYSWLCRLAVRQGQMTSNQVCQGLFGHQEPLSGYIFKPFRLKDIQRWFGDQLIRSGLRFGKNHSCYPYYMAFLSPSHAARVAECHTGSTLTSGQAKRINRDCGFPHNHKKRLWYCPICVQQDFLQYGETYWRRLPQMPGAVYCPIHKISFQESGISFRDINYQIIPASYAMIHVQEPVQQKGTVYSNRYIELAEDIAWLLNKGYSISDGEWLMWSFFEMTGKPINGHLLYDTSRSPYREGCFQDYLATRIMEDSGKDRIDLTVSRQLGTILSIEDSFGTVEKFCSI